MIRIHEDVNTGKQVARLKSLELACFMFQAFGLLAFPVMMGDYFGILGLVTGGAALAILLAMAYGKLGGSTLCELTQDALIVNGKSCPLTSITDLRQHGSTLRVERTVGESIEIDCSYVTTSGVQAFIRLVDAARCEPG